MKGNIYSVAAKNGSRMSETWRIQSVEDGTATISVTRGSDYGSTTRTVQLSKDRVQDKINAGELESISV